MKVASIGLLFLYFYNVFDLVCSSKSQLKAKTSSGIFGSLKLFKDMSKAGEAVTTVNHIRVENAGDKQAKSPVSQVVSKNLKLGNSEVKKPVQIPMSFAQKSGAKSSTLKKGILSDFKTDQVNNIGEKVGSPPLTVGPISWKGWVKYKGYKNVDEDSILKGNGQGKVTFARNDYFLKQRQMNANIDLSEMSDNELRYVKDDTSFYLSLFNHVITIHSSREVSELLIYN